MLELLLIAAAVVLTGTAAVGLLSALVDLFGLLRQFRPSVQRRIDRLHAWHDLQREVLAESRDYVRSVEAADGKHKGRARREAEELGRRLAELEKEYAESQQSVERLKKELDRRDREPRWPNYVQVYLPGAIEVRTVGSDDLVPLDLPDSHVVQLGPDELREAAELKLRRETVLRQAAARQLQAGILGGSAAARTVILETAMEKRRAFLEARSSRPGEIIEILRGEDP